MKEREFRLHDYARLVQILFSYPLSEGKNE